MFWVLLPVVSFYCLAFFLFLLTPEFSDRLVKPFRWFFFNWPQIYRVIHEQCNPLKEIQDWKLRKKIHFDSFYIKNSKWPPPSLMRRQSIWRTRFEEARINTKGAQQSEAFNTLLQISSFWIRRLIDDTSWVVLDLGICGNKLFTNEFVQLTFIINTCWFCKRKLIVTHRECEIYYID